MRLLIVMPTWVGDAVMATPALRVLRSRMPGAFIGALARPPVDELLAGSDLLDEIHVDRRAGVMGPKHAAARVRMRNYAAALLLSNSFSSALTTRLAFIPRRVGYARDGRSLLLTETLDPPRRRDTPPYSRSSARPDEYAPVPACDYYVALARRLLDLPAAPLPPLELAVAPAQDDAAAHALRAAGLDPGRLRAAILCPGGNNPAKRWPPDRFAKVARRLLREHALDILLSGSPGEAALVSEIAQLVGPPPEGRRVVELPALGLTLGALKGVVRRCALMLTNDTGPRHIAAAFRVPVVTLFGPTDHRWTTIPFDREARVLADPALPEEEVANDHPERCAIERIEVDRVVAAVDAILRAD